MQVPIIFAIISILACSSAVMADTSSHTERPESFKTTQDFEDFPDLTGALSHSASNVTAPSISSEPSIKLAAWPFASGTNTTATVTPKSTRKAFFLSLLVPGLGEMYVGSKRSYAFLGIEAFAWWMYLTNTQEGNDIEDDYERFADSYWHYTDTHTAAGDTLYYNYWEWLRKEYTEIDQAGIQYDDYEAIRLIVEKNKSAHSLPSTKTQQYYEMIGKYDHFVYGWEDIMENTASLHDAEGNPTFKYDENQTLINSPLRERYMSMRKESNDELKAGQRGIYILIINRILSAIDAGRLAYKHNKNLDTDLSMIQVRVAQPRFVDSRVPMVIVSKRF